MKKKAIEVRKKMIVVRMNNTELESFEKLIKRTTVRNVSEYARDILLAKPVTVKFRNISADTFFHELLAIKSELNSIGNNFNQAVHKLHLLDRIPEFRDWIHTNDMLQQLLIKKTEETKLLMTKIYEKLVDEKPPAKNTNDKDDLDIILTGNM